MLVSTPVDMGTGTPVYGPEHGHTSWGPAAQTAGQETLSKAELPLSGQLKWLRLGCCVPARPRPGDRDAAQSHSLVTEARGQRVRSTPGVCLEESLEQIKSQFVFQCRK